MKRNDKEKLKGILEKYAPVFDKYVAVQYELENIPPPTCNECGARTVVALRKKVVCHSCHINKDKLTKDKLQLLVKENIEVVSVPNNLAGTKETATFRCTLHDNEYQQVIFSTLKGINGCKQCVSENVAAKVNYPVSAWIDKAKSAHNNFYDYSKSEDVKRYNDKVTIICPKHGEFKQQISLHLNGYKCKKCGLEEIGKKKRSTLDYFISRAKEVHGEKYDYSKVEYIHMHEKITIICPKHGEFNQVAYYHTNGSGCPNCNYTMTRSKAEYEIVDFLKNECSVENVEHSYRGLGFEIDIYLPDFKLGIEFNGLYWHSSNNRETDISLSKKHIDKTIAAESNGIHLLHIFENEWNTKKDIWKSVIRQKLGLSQKIYARQCQVIKLNSQETSIFFEMNHLQGTSNKAESMALIYKGDIVAAIILGKARYTKSCDYEIIRYANKKFTSVIGGFSRLLKHVTKGKSGVVVSYANRRWSKGDVYYTNGFELLSTSKPCYYYWKGSDYLEHRSAYMKHMLESKLDVYDSSKSEVDNMYENGYRRIWDCGTLVFSKQI